VLPLFVAARPRALDPAELLRALGRAIEALLRESVEVRGMAAQLETPLRGLVSERWPAG
jgi:hypothetical protein